MRTRTLILALMFTAAASCDRAPKADPSKPEAYAVRLALEPAKGAVLQRLTLPAQALVALRRDDRGDIRLFDARGKLVPIALLDDGGETRPSTPVPVYPVVGSASVLGTAGLSIRIEDDKVARIVTVDRSAPPTDRAALPTAVLLDTRTVRDPAITISLDVAIPAGKPVTLTVLASANLKEWEPLAEKVLFRPGDALGVLGGATIALPGVDLRDRYVGISWGRATGVELKGASVITSTLAPPEQTAVRTNGLTLADPHEVRFNLPDLAALAAVRLTAVERDGVIPATLFGRDGDQDPWTLLAATTLRPGDSANLLDLSGLAMNHYRIVADRRTAGFSAPPRLDLLFDPVELLVALSGTPPYKLVVGQRDAPGAYLSLAEIAPQWDPLKLADLPQAKFAAPSRPAPIIALRTAAADGAFAPRKLLLWAALLLGTLVLVVAAIQLLRANAANAPVEEDTAPDENHHQA